MPEFVRTWYRKLGATQAAYRTADIEFVLANYYVSCSESSKCWPFEDLKQDRQCTYNVTLRRIRTTTVAVEKQ